MLVVVDACVLADGAFGAAEALAACNLAAFVDLERAKARVARGVVMSRETIRIEGEHCVRGRSERRSAGLDMVDQRSCDCWIVSRMTMCGMRLQEPGLARSNLGAESKSRITEKGNATEQND